MTRVTGFMTINHLKWRDIDMRDIKFRAWDKQSHIWLDNDEYVIKPDSGSVSEIDYADVM